MDRTKVQLVKVLKQSGKGVEINRIIDETVKTLSPCAEVLPPIEVADIRSWRGLVTKVARDVDALILPGNTVYAHRETGTLVRLGIPVIYWKKLGAEEVNMWTWDEAQHLRLHGLEVFSARDSGHACRIVRAIGARAALKKTKALFIGNPKELYWGGLKAIVNAWDRIGLEVKCVSQERMLEHADRITEKEAGSVWEKQKASFKQIKVEKKAVVRAIKVFLSIKALVEEEDAGAVSLDCYGGLSKNPENMPCLALWFLKREGYVTSCEMDIGAIAAAIISMALTGKQNMMCNLYPLLLRENIKRHFGGKELDEALTSSKPEQEWENLARYAHTCNLGVIPPELAVRGEVSVDDWYGKGMGCVIDGELNPHEEVTLASLSTELRSLYLFEGIVKETTRFPDRPYCRSAALLELPGISQLVENGTLNKVHFILTSEKWKKNFLFLAEIMGLKVIA